MQLRQADSRDASGLAARFPRLADQTLKGLEGLPGKPAVEFADLLRLGNGGLISPLHKFGVNRHRLFERPSAAELLEKRPEILERFPGVVAIGVRDGLQGSPVRVRPVRWSGRARVLPLQVRPLGGLGWRGRSGRQRLGRREDGRPARRSTARLVHLRALCVNRPAAAVDPVPGFAVEPAPGSSGGPSWKPSFCPGALAPPSGCAVRISRPVCPRLYSTFFFPVPNVKPNGKTLPCLRWNRGSCLSVARHSRGDILKAGAGGRLCRLRTRLLFLLACFP